MIKCLEAVFLVFALQEAAGFLMIPVLLAVIWVKAKTSGMRGEQWMVYVQGMKNSCFVILILTVYLIPLFLLSAAGFALYGLLDLGNPLLLSALTFLFGVLRFVLKLDDRKKELWRLIGKLG